MCGVEDGKCAYHRLVMVATNEGCMVNICIPNCLPTGNVSKVQGAWEPWIQAHWDKSLLEVVFNLLGNLLTLTPRNSDKIFEDLNDLLPNFQVDLERSSVQ